MPSRVILFSGASAVGKTAAVKALLPLLNIAQCCVCKIDCLRTQDDEAYRRMGVPCVAGLSRDICPDHFLVSNLPELWQWADAQNRPTLLLETAGLCHRCSPATREMIAGCVLDCTVSCRAPEQLGPMLTQADFVVLTKIDMVPRLNWKSSAGRSARSIPARPSSLWTVWRDTAWICSPAGCSPSLNSRI